MGSSKVFGIIILIAIFLLVASGSYWVFRMTSAPKTGPKPKPTTPAVTMAPVKKSKIDPSIPRTEVCPLNGAMFTKPEADVWVTRRPLAVMIENSTDSRPQSGLSTADIIYEAVAEGGITRFMAVFYCNAALSGNLQLAPVRSARIYYVNIASEYDALYNHVGGAGHCDDINVDPRAKALCLIRTGKIKDLDQMGYAGEFKICHRVTNRLDKETAYEHTMSCFLDELYIKAEKMGWTNIDEKKIPWDKSFVPWKFQAEADTAMGAPAADFSYQFWGNLGGSFDVQWKYDAAAKSYKRFNGGEQSSDLNTGEPLEFKNVVVQFAKETNLGDLEKHILYDVIGTNKAKIFMDGVVIDGTWSKANRTARTIFKDSKGVEIKFNPGPIWISIVPVQNQVTVN